MATFFNVERLPLLEQADLLVVGGGSAGCLAALAARRAGIDRVLLIERYGFAGGTSTQMLDTFYGFFTPGTHPRKIVGGLPDAVVDELEKTDDVFLRPNTYGAGTGVTYNPERLKMVWDNLLLRSGVRLFLHTGLVAVEQMDDAGATVIVWHKDGHFRIQAKKVIDASGDADFCHYSGIPYERAGEHEPAQSLTTTFRMANVDLATFQRAGGKQMLMEKMAEAVDKGLHPLPRRQGSAHRMVQEGCIATVAVKVAGYNPLDVREATLAEIEGRRQAFVYEAFFRDMVPGYERAKIIGLSHQIGVRETRRVYGMYRLTAADCLTARVPADSIFLCGAPIEDHRPAAKGEAETHWQYIPGDGVYGVPYGVIVPRNSVHTWMVGRCFSATHDAHASCRSMAQTMSMGQAAGLAAALCLKEEYAAREVPVDRLRQKLKAWGAVLTVPDWEADTSAKGWKKNRLQEKAGL